MAKKRSPREERDMALLEATGTQTIEAARIIRLRETGEALAAEGIDITPFLENIGVIMPKLSYEEKVDYARIKLLEKVENDRVGRKDIPPYDGGDPDETGDPEQDAWLKGDFWVRRTVRVI